MVREKRKTWTFVALTTALLLLASPTALIADEAAGGPDGSTFWSWLTSLHEWIVEALLDAVPDEDTPTPEAPAPEDQQCHEPEGCAEQFPTADPNG
ncbi:MAG: hypothetical protein AAGE94_02170 [Acidobacteriota bacterium]